MRALVWLSLLVPAMAAGGTFVSGNSTLPGPKVDAKACTNPDPNKCLRASDFNALREALFDLRTALDQHVSRMDGIDATVAPIQSLEPCPSGLYRSDASGKLVCETVQLAGPSQCTAYTADGWVARAVATNPITPVAEQLLAFKGCEGTACLSTGGRGGTIYEVTNLNDAGAGSLRACVAASGQRVCVFRVAGRIALASRLDVTNPYLYVAAHTAPGPVEIYGKNLATKVVRVVTHDVVWRYTRIRKGFNAGTAAQSGNPVSIEAGAYNVLFDHNSLSWTQDENFTIWSDGAVETAPRNIVASWNIMAEPLSDHPASTICGSNTAAVAAAMTGIDFHHNYLPNSDHRNPNFGCGSGRWVNNIVYNWDYYASRTEEGAAVDFINNIYKSGPLGGGSQNRTHEIHIFPTGDGGSPDGTPSIYVLGNKGPNHADPAATSSEWADMVRAIDANGEIAGEADAGYKRNAPLSLGGAPLSPTATDSLEAALIASVGASRRLACDGTWTSARDPADARVITDYNAGTGGMFADETTGCGGGTCWPTLTTASACVDTDHDGMPDAWEAAQGLNANSDADAWLVAAGQVYPNLERFLNGP